MIWALGWRNQARESAAKCPEGVNLGYIDSEYNVYCAVGTSDETNLREVCLSEGGRLDPWNRSRVERDPAVGKKAVPLSRFPGYIRKGSISEFPLAK